MKYVIVLFPMLLLLSACAGSPGRLTKEAIAAIAPDVPAVTQTMQKAAAAEMEGGKCPVLNHLANLCLITRDQARALKQPSP